MARGSRVNETEGTDISELLDVANETVRELCDADDFSDVSLRVQFIVSLLNVVTERDAPESRIAAEAIYDVAFLLGHLDHDAMPAALAKRLSAIDIAVGQLPIEWEH